MSTSPNPLRVRLACRDVWEFRQKFPVGRTARAFVATDVPRDLGQTITVDFVFADGQIGARGEGVVASKGKLGGRLGIVVQLREIACSDEEGDVPLPIGDQPSMKLSHSTIIDDLIEDRAEPAPVAVAPPPPSAPQAAPEPRRRPGRWRWPVAGAAASLVIAGFLVGVFYGRGTPAVPARPDDKAERVRAAIAAADDHIASGRLVGPGENALDQLVAARRLDPENPEVARRLELLSDKFEELAQGALRNGDLAEAATHVQAALNATPDRERLKAAMRTIEARMAGPPADAGPAAPQ